MSEKTIWVCFDLAFGSSCQGLYTWLDKVGAQDCGDSMAVIKYKSEGDFLSEIDRELKLHVKPADSDRIYIIYKDDDSGKVCGRFINGGRKRAVWDGFWRTDESESVDE